MCGRVAGKWPAAKLGALVISKGLPYLGFAIHDKQAILHNRLTNRFALQQQKFTGLVAIDKRNFYIALQLNSAVTVQVLPADADRLAFEKIQVTSGARIGRRQIKACTGLHAQRPDSNVRLGLRRP